MEDQSEEQPGLYHAVRSSNMALARQILEEGTRLGRVEDSALWFVLDFAIGDRNIEMIELLLEYDARYSPDVSLRSQFLSDELFDAVRSRNARLQTVLLRLGAKVGLHQAAWEGNTERVRQLLEQGLPVDGGRNYGEGWYQDGGESPLQWAALRGHTETVRVLLEHGADVNYEDVHGDTPLTEALIFPHKEIVRILVEAGADVNFRSWRLSVQEMTEASEDVGIRKLLLQTEHKDKQ